MISYRRLSITIATCLLATVAGINTAQSQVTLCHGITGLGHGGQDVTGCVDGADCGPMGTYCCLHYTCSGHPGHCNSNCGQACSYIYDCSDIYESGACSYDCT